MNSPAEGGQARQGRAEFMATFRPGGTPNRFPQAPSVLGSFLANGSAQSDPTKDPFSEEHRESDTRRVREDVA